MVVKLTGKVNSETIIFERKAGGLWVTAIPRVKSGAYVVERQQLMKREMRRFVQNTS